ncbi:hypothetical protein PR202_ga27479 [Eleusine coracana subsp. coracana]|uniref:F-box domain-containing protein n=1 Tax=Eleusine coracana subsp. coracana TaxID=191504 RepID=A0AAV5DG77_ELECO|nr:hypothetical protein QOZ80_8AG0620310 [Eleusine coracana subsp. coracana]GJN09470.1 hypothetical protein PR202_ga27479 [Eleusine coracana subsp. coracana]
MASQSSPRNHRRRPRLPPTPTDEVETRDWAELPRDLLLVVLQRLDIASIVFGAGHVCRTWRRVTREEPELWRRIDIRSLPKPAPHGVNGSQLRALAHTALWRSAGRCEAFWTKGITEDDYIAFFRRHTAPMLKSLRLISCEMSTVSLSIDIKRFPLLEELELSLHSSESFDNTYMVCAAAAKACPHLKILRLIKDAGYHWNSRVLNKDKEAMEIAKMRQLRSLQLSGNSLSNDGLAAILGGCVHLEFLDIHPCFNISMRSDSMYVRCARIRTFRHS